MGAFAAAIAKGASNFLTWKKILATALVFGIVETITPFIGWSIGSMAKQLISEWDHWIAFGLLVVLGLRMIKEGLSDDEGDDDEPKSQNWLLVVITAIATSTDSLIVGVGLAFLSVNIFTIVTSIGLATTVMTTIGLSIGRSLGKRVGKRAEIFGGIVLIGIGTSILYSHLSA